MQQYALSFDHLGLAVRQPDGAVAFLRGLGYSIGQPVHDPLQNVNLVLCTSTAMPAIEVISPTDTPGPLQAILASASQQQMIYHICYRCPSAEPVLQAMKRDGLRVLCVSPPKPAVLFAGRRVSFHMVKGFGLIEILETGAEGQQP